MHSGFSSAAGADLLVHVEQKVGGRPVGVGHVEQVRAGLGREGRGRGV